MESTTATTTAQQPTEQQREANQVRFETELEVSSLLSLFLLALQLITDILGVVVHQFIQCLANPFYLQCKDAFHPLGEL